MNTNIKKLLALFIIISLITGCTQSIFTTKDNDTLLHTLSSDLYRGRMIGTEGNILAEQKLVDIFKTIGLEPYDGKGYLYEYEQTYYPLDKQKITMIITFNNEKSYCLKYGEDFLEKIPIANFDMECPVISNINELPDKDVFILVDGMQVDDFELTKIMDLENIKAVLFKTDVLRKNIRVWPKSKPFFQLEPSIYDKLANASNSKVHIKVEMTEEKIKANNVIGKITGNNNKEALIISAHFDHVGWAGDTIYNGALDNASGIYAITELAKRLKKYSENHLFPRDIYICAFNGEETGLNGSMSFVEYIKPKYEKVVAINLDTIGLKGGKVFDIVGNQHVSGMLIESIAKYLNDRDIRCNILYTNNLVSDHIAFSDAHIPALTIGEQDISYIHTEKDTIDIIDIQRINRLVNELFEYIITEQDKIFDNEKLFECEEHISDEAEEEFDEKYRAFYQEQIKDVPFDKYKVVKYDGILFSIYNINKTFYSVDEVNSIYDKLHIEENYGGYKLGFIKIIDSSCPDVDYKAIELNKLYDRQLSVETIETLKLIYKNKNKETKGFHVAISTLPVSLSQLLQDNPFEIKTIYVDNRTYTILYDKNTNIVWGINFKLNDKLYISLLRGEIIERENPVIKSDLKVDNIEDIKRFIKFVDVSKLTNYKFQQNLL
ncbi:hypothetical protein Y919_07405 [Caloranaerobacter azorensis H53214]|uniref:Peptidase M28 domain-containing protein n=1 Tax=Caloranaerobacter azorensis H53214 TaxID=1156417 RepID=A0A096CUK1_9FIRM|nr:M28 family metallopeptidase [Caloranaerobacter azorensis]KGG80219.1 hypothetical protein Y919_07405 [Caloranaerobacter azorensis H53214]